MYSTEKAVEIMREVCSACDAVFTKRISDAYLFGSYARGDYDEESDIDVLILVDLPSDELPAYRAHIDSLCGKLLLTYGIVVSAIEKDTKTYKRYSDILPFYKNIEKDGVKIA